MKKIYNYWLPSTDDHFERLIKKRINAGGPAEYQDDVRTKAYQFVKNFNVAIDVGANIGFWTRPLAYKFKKVIAFEPVDNLMNYLKENTKNQNIEYNKLILGDKKSYANMRCDDKNIGNNVVDIESYGRGDIPVDTIDNLDLNHFDFIKIDCQGYDYFVLNGGIKTFEKYKPIIVFEQENENNNNCHLLLHKIGAIKLGQVRKDNIYGWINEA